MGLTMTQMNQRTVQLLLRQAQLSAEQAEVVLEQATRRGVWVGLAAVDGGYLSDRDLAVGLATQFDVPLAPLDELTSDPAALACLSSESCRRGLMVPLSLRHNVLRLAVANPLQELPADALPRPRAYAVSLQVAPLQAIRRAIDRWYAAPLAAMSAPPPEHRPAHRPDRRLLQVGTPAPNVEEFRGQLHDLLAAMIEHGGTDLHLTVGMRPLMRVDGALQPLPFLQLDPNLLQHLVYAILSEAQTAVFEQRHELDLAYSTPDGGRFRVNVFRQRGAVGAVLRAIPAEIPTLAYLGFPHGVLALTRKTHGLVLVTGPTASGTTTILAAFIDEINRARGAHIITIEDPIEFVHKSKKSEINQRQVGTDTDNYVTALHQALRQDPDVILVDRLPDRATVAAALGAAETGHLIIAALPTLGAVPTLQHLLNAFPAAQHPQVCARLANVLEGIITQVLVPGETGAVTYAREILLATPAVRARIRDGRLHHLPALQRAGGKEGMMLLEQSLRRISQDAGRRTLDLRSLLPTVSHDKSAASTEHPEDYPASPAAA
jgi:twitching motility protein PilT